MYSPGGTRGPGGVPGQPTAPGTRTGPRTRMFQLNAFMPASAEIVGFAVDESFKKSDSFLGKPVYGFKDLEKGFDDVSVFLALGYSDLRARREVFQRIKALGYPMVTFISPHADVDPSAKLGTNNVVMAGVIIEPFVAIEDNNIFWSGNHIGHHSKIAHNNFISSHVVISGHCKIENNSFFGVNSTIADGITIGNRNLIGPGALIQKDTEDDGVYFGKRSSIFKRDSSWFFQ